MAADVLTVFSDWQLWIAPVGFILGGLLVGLFVERILITATRRVLREESWLTETEGTGLLRGTIAILFLLGGLHLATFNIPYVREGVLLGLRKVIFILGMLLAIRLIANILLAMIRKITAKAGKAVNLPHTSIFENLVRFVVLLVGLLVILQTLGISILPILTALGVGGLAVSLALQDTLANLFAGIHMILARQIKVGDTIQLENGKSGKVEDIGWRTTILQELAGNRIILPNSKLAQSIIINFTGPHPDLTVSLPFSVSVDSDLDKVEAIAHQVALETGKKLLPEGKKSADFQPSVRYLSFGESWINLQLNMPFKKHQDPGLVRHELIKALHARLLAEGIRLPFPQNILHITKDDTGRGTGGGNGLQEVPAEN